ncbi:MAG: hypothetical protein PSV35_03035, partial [bacterium]|nr:hypothetical protein [bacterium]
GAVVFVMLTPIAPAVGSAFALTAVVLTGVNLLWRMIPYNWKQAIKHALHLGKPQLIENTHLDDALEAQNDYAAEVSVGTYHRIFSQCDHSAEIKIRDLPAGINYLHHIINKKIDNFNKKPIPHSEINIQKEELLSILRLSIDKPDPLSKRHLLEQYPLAFQSFWADKGEVEHIYDAVVVLKSKYLAQKTAVLPTELGEVPCTLAY